MSALQEELPLFEITRHTQPQKLEKVSNAFPTRQMVASYASLIFQGLATSESIKPRKIGVEASISERTFQKYLQLPFLVSKQLFWAFNGQKQSTLSEARFKSGILLLLFGSQQEKLELVFKLLQISQSDRLHQSQCCALLYHIGISQNQEIFGFSKRKSQSQKSIDQAIKSMFAWAATKGAPKKSIDLPDFAYFSKMIEGDIPQLVLSFIYEKSALVQRTQEYQASLLSEPGRRSPYPFSALSLRQPTARYYGLAEMGHIRFLKEFPPIRRLYSVPHQPTAKGAYPLITKSRSLGAVSQPSTSLLQQLDMSPRHRALTQRYSEDEKEDFLKKKAKLLHREQCDESLKWHAGKVYRFVDENRIQAFWYELRNGYLYMFKNDSARAPRKILPLSSGFGMKENGMRRRLDGRIFYSFDLIFPSGCKKELLIKEQAEYTRWVECIRETVSRFDFEREFQITETFQVSANEISLSGFSVYTGVSVFITQLYKGKAGATAIEQAEYERDLHERIEIIKACKHPLFPKLLRIEETPDLFYVIEEGIEGESLESFISRGAATESVVKVILQKLTEMLSFAKKMKVLLNLKISSLIVCCSEEEPSYFLDLKLVSLKHARFLLAEEDEFQSDVLQAGLIMRRVALHCFLVSHLEESLEGKKAALSWDSFGIGLSSLIKKMVMEDSQLRIKAEGMARMVPFL